MPPEQNEQNEQNPPGAPVDNHFSTQTIENTGQTIVNVKAGITLGDWDVLTALVRTRMQNGAIDWELDLRQVQMLTSMIMGSIVGINMILQTRKGSLHLIVLKGSRVASMLELSKLNRIITVREI